MTFQYLVYDIESVVDKALLNRILFSDAGLSDEEAYTKHVADLMEKNGSNFVNASFHIPVCLATLAVEKDFSIIKIGLLGEGARKPTAIVRHFWDMYNKNNFVLVDFNGRGYDARLMELWAYRMGISIHYKHFDKFGVRYRYSDDKHLDLQEALTNNMSIRLQGGLNLFAKLINKPGKLETKGDQVQAMFEAGQMFEIEDYCLGDALDTYFVFLRWMVVKGTLSLNQEAALVDKALDKMNSYAQETGYLKKYLAAFKKWEPLD